MLSAEPTPEVEACRPERAGAQGGKGPSQIRRVGVESRGAADKIREQGQEWRANARDEGDGSGAV